MKRIEIIMIYISFTLYLIKELLRGNPGLHFRKAKVGGVNTGYDRGSFSLLKRVAGFGRYSQNRIFIR